MLNLAQARYLPMLASLAGLAAAFTTDSRLHRSLFGVAYSPDGVILPNCGATQSAVTKDMEILAQLTPRIRTYGCDCNQTQLVLQGIKDAGDVDLSVWVGIYINGNDTVYDRQVNELVDAINTYGADHIAGVTVGNEYILNAYGDTGTATGANGVAARTELLKYIEKFNYTLQGLNLNKNIPIGTSDAGAAATVELCEAIDYYMANVHPWFGSVEYAGASEWTFNFYEEFDLSVCAKSTRNPTMYIAETGWPTESMDTKNAVNGAKSPASIEGLQTFLDDFVCAANSNGTNYFFFEGFDETWKEQYGGVEPYWGLYNNNRTLKDITIPTCLVDSPTGSSDPTNSSSGSSSSNDNSAAEPMLAISLGGMLAAAALGVAAGF